MRRQRRCGGIGVVPPSSPPIAAATLAATALAAAIAAIATVAAAAAVAAALAAVAAATHALSALMDRDLLCAWRSWSEWGEKRAAALRQVRRTMMKLTTSLQQLTTRQR